MKRIHSIILSAFVCSAAFAASAVSYADEQAAKDLKMVRSVAGKSEEKHVTASLMVYAPPLHLERGKITNQKSVPEWLDAYRASVHYNDYSYSKWTPNFTKEYLSNNNVTEEVFEKMKKSYPEGTPRAKTASALWAVKAEADGNSYLVVAVYYGAHLAASPKTHSELPNGVTEHYFKNENGVWKMTSGDDLWFLRFPMNSQEKLRDAFKSGEVEAPRKTSSHL